MMRRSGRPIGTTVAVFCTGGMLALAIGCESTHKSGMEGPSAVNEPSSDTSALALAHRTMDAMGGSDAWNNARYFRWTFFSHSRTHYWDKARGRARVEMHDQGGGPDTLVLLNINTQQGRSFVGTKEVTDTDANAQNLKRAYGAWVNDGYWLFMPYKLTDPGVTLEHLGSIRLDDGRSAQRVQLTFDNVGLTPQNKYWVDIADDTGLVAQWSYFATADQAKPNFTIPWNNWRHYGPIMLSDDRGNGRALTDLAVYRTLPDSVFDDPAPVDATTLKPCAVTR